MIGVPTGAGEKEAEEADSGKCQMLDFSKVLVISCLLGLVELFFCSQCLGFHQLNYQPFTGVIAERGEVATGGKVGEIGVTGETEETGENEGSGERGNTMGKGEGGECTINSWVLVFVFLFISVFVIDIELFPFENAGEKVSDLRFVHCNTTI